MGDASDLARLFGAVLDLCKLKEGETLAILTQDNERADYAAAYLAAAQQRGVHGFQLNLAKRMPEPGAKTKRTALSGNAPAVKALKSVDILIDTVGLLWSAEQKEIQDAGTRILLCREPAENIAKMFPTPELRRRVEAGQKMLQKAKTMRITSPAGTDVTYKLGRFPTVTQYGYTDEPGRWDHCPGGFLYTGGYEDGVDGTVVINTGDIVFPFKRYMSGPIRLTVEKGYVTKIEGDSTEAELLRAFMARWNDPRAYAISHIGWGMDEKAQWDFLATSPIASQTFGVDGRSYYGNVLFSTGPNVELGGTNDTGCHLDIPLRGCSLFLDNQPIVEAGKIVPPELQAGRP